WPDDIPPPHAWCEFDVDSVEAATAELEARGYRMLVKNQRESWGQTVPDAGRAIDWHHADAGFPREGMMPATGSRWRSSGCTSHWRLRCLRSVSYFRGPSEGESTTDVYLASPRVKAAYRRRWVGHTSPSYFLQNATMILPAARLTI